jgi:HK97 gp10 family phage protein
MPLAVSVKLKGDKQLIAALDRLQPRKNPEPIRRALLRGAFRIQQQATTVHIIAGGDGPPDPVRITSRTGTGRRSIAVDQAGLRSLVVEVGSGLVYMAVHEGGGRFHPARPWLGPAVADVEAELPEIFVTEWERGALS